jgi:hypothetical protein
MSQVVGALVLSIREHELNQDGISQITELGVEIYTTSDHLSRASAGDNMKYVEPRL